MSQPDYLSISPPGDKSPKDYTWAERRAEIADAIERKGHYRLLERSQRQMGDQYGVSQNQIKEDIQRINEQRGSQLGDRAEGELDTLHTRAIEDLLEQGDSEAAYYLMRKHYETLMDAGAADQEKDADKHQHEHGGEGWFDRMDEALSGETVNLAENR